MGSATRRLTTRGESRTATGGFQEQAGELRPAATIAACERDGAGRSILKRQPN